MQPVWNDRAAATLGALACLSLTLSLAITGCHPDPRCDGEYYYSEGSCNGCPEGSTFADNSCVCDDGALHFEGGECVLPDGGLPPEMDTDDGLDAGDVAGGDPACADYCDFMDGCIAQNDTAVSLAPSIASGLSDPCASDCAANTEPGDPVIACVTDGRAAAACDGTDDIAGVLAALSLVDACCLANDGSALCANLCEVVSTDALVGSMVKACQ